MITIIDKKKRHNVGTLKILGHPTINVTKLNHIPVKGKIGRIHLTVTLIIEKRRKTYVVDAVMTEPLGHKCRNNQTIQCIIINGKEVQVSKSEILSDSNTDTDSE